MVLECEDTDYELEDGQEGREDTEEAVNEVQLYRFVPHAAKSVAKVAQ